MEGFDLGAIVRAGFDGQTYEPKHDEKRLGNQLLMVQLIMSDRQWHTLQELADATGGTVAGVSARVRDLRKAKFGGFEIERERVVGGLHRYRWNGEKSNPTPAKTKRQLEQENEALRARVAELESRLRIRERLNDEVTVLRGQMDLGLGA
jgi:hypothetical protein